jgi:hypothetical protein
VLAHGGELTPGARPQAFKLRYGLMESDVQAQLMDAALALAAAPSPAQAQAELQGARLPGWLLAPPPPEGRPDEPGAAGDDAAQPEQQQRQQHLLPGVSDPAGGGGVDRLARDFELLVAATGGEWVACGILGAAAG